MAKVTKLKAGPTRWDPDNLHRHPDFARVRKETSIKPLKQQPSMPLVKQEACTDMDERQAAIEGLGEDEFGSDDFDAVDFAVSDGDHPDEVMLDASLSSGRFPGKTNYLKRKNSSEVRTRDSRNTPRLPSPSSRTTGPQTPSTGREPQRPPPPLFQDLNKPISNAALPEQDNQRTTYPPQPHSPSLDCPNYQGHEPPVGFFTARAAESLQAGPNPAIKAPLFNPHLESPSIRKTAGIDHTKTKPVNRDLTEAAPPPLPPPSVATAGSMPRGNVVNPQTDRARRVGMPAGAGSPLHNRGSYKPPQMKRPVEGAILKDVTAASLNVGNPLESKRQKGVVENGELQGNDGMVKV